MSRRFAGRVAVVTGAGRGIGRETALLFAREGARVVVNDLGTAINGQGSDTKVADQVVREITQLGGAAVASHDSVASMEGGQHIIQTALDAFGRIDILVNNAGIMRDASVLEMTEADWDLVIAVNLKGLFVCTQVACRAMVPQRYGRIVNLSSRNALGTGRFGALETTGRINYAAAKAGVLGFTRALAREAAPYGITCNAIMPTAKTRLLLAAQEQRQAKGIPIGPESSEARHPADVAPLIVYLAATEAGGITGRTFSIDRGHIELYSDPSPVKDVQKAGRWTVSQLAKTLSKIVL